MSKIDILKDLGIEKYKEHFAEEIPLTPKARYISLVVIRETKSHCIFTTEQDVLNTASVQSGRNRQEVMERVVLFKRKQVAPERRTGKSLLRKYEIMELDDCYLMEKLCGKCPDCLLYGAIRQAVSQKSRLLVDNAYSIRDYDLIHERLTFQAIDEKTGRPGAAFNDRDHVRPETFFICVITLRDVTPLEFAYALLNELRTKRYGAEGTRIGYVENHVVGIIFSDAECLSNLDLTQRIYDKLVGNGEQPSTIIYEDITKHMDNIVKEAISEEAVVAQIIGLKEAEEIIRKFSNVFRNEERVKDFLVELKSQADVYLENYGKSKGIK